jgi:hypothetical protein
LASAHSGVVGELAEVAAEHPDTDRAGLRVPERRRHLLDTAVLHHLMWSEGQTQFASEIRLRVSKFGATPEDRSRSRIEVSVQPVNGEKPSNVIDIHEQAAFDARRARLIAQNPTSGNPQAE